MSEIRKYPPARETFVLFIKMLREVVDPYDSRDKFHLYGYNAKFDYDFLRAWFEKLGSPYFGSYVWYPPIDVMNLAADYFEKIRHELPNFKLVTVAAALGANIEGSRLHDAVYDIFLTRFIYHELKKLPHDTIEY